MQSTGRYLFLPVLICALSVCAGDDVFLQHVWPVLDRQCISCHGPEKQKAALRLDSREALLKGGESGPAIVLGKPRESLLIKLVHHEDSDRTMPPKSKLTEAEIRAFELWITNGAPWSKTPERVATVKAGERIGDAWTDKRNPIVKIFHGQRLDLWSVKPPSNVQLDLAVDKTHPIDRLVQKKTALAPVAEKRALLRRIHFDLTGLPPTPEEMKAFLADTAPDAYEKAVDRLLASPRYGEHWARMWLDTIRYSDSNGFDWDEYRPLAWRFRDYVIRALNQDKPYDRFVREQLAGDELVPGEPRDAAEQDALIATTYLRLGPWDNSAAQFGEQDRVRLQMMNDLVETTGAAFLGTAMSCCRCHDHKSDPLSQDDFYRMRAFFEPVQFRDDLALDLAPAQAEIRAHNQGLDKQRDEVRKTRGDVFNVIKTRVREERTAKLEPAEKDLLQRRADVKENAEKETLKKIDKKLEVSDDDARKAATADEKKTIETHDKKLEELKKQLRAFTTGLLAADGEANKPTRVLFQGNIADPRNEVVPGFFSILDPNPATIEKATRPKSSGRRTTLANWIVSPSNPLTTRVLVNRVWQQYFGTGLVATANDFGLAGAKPVHPELLDWLAAEFVRQGWSLKKLHRLILTSGTYQQAARGGTLALNQPLRRLSAEQLRDSMLSVSGKLEMSAGGAPVWPTLPKEVLNANPVFLDGDNDAKTKHWYASPAEKLNIRSIFLIQKRTTRIPFLETFDQPENATSCARRAASTVAPQALTLLNNEFALDCSKALAARVEKDAGADESAQIGRVFELALQRAPNEKEWASCREFRKKRTLVDLCRAVLNLNEFIFLD